MKIPLQSDINSISPQLPMVEVASSIIMGTRKYQQDACWHTIQSDRHELLAVICDGMGGLSGGEKASQLGISTLAGLYQQYSPVADIPTFLWNAAHTANQAVNSLTDDRGQPLKAGSTMIAVFIRDQIVHWLSVGDSHIYLIRDCEIYPCCREHNYQTRLMERIKSGEITEAQAAADPQRRDALTSYLGIPKLREIEVNKVPNQLQPNDIMLMCSDGLYKSLSDEEICRAAVENKMNLQSAADTLTAMALSHAKGGQDNTTVTLIKFNGDWFGDHYFG